MEPAFVVMIILIVALVAIGVSHQRDLKIQRAEMVVRLMYAENEQERQDLKQEARKLAMVVTEEDDQAWRDMWQGVTAKEKQNMKQFVLQPTQGAPDIAQLLDQYLGVPDHVRPQPASTLKTRGKHVIRGAWRRMARKLSDLEQDGR